MRKILSRKHSFPWLVVPAACLVLAGCTDVERSTGDKQAWASPGNFVVSYGPVVEPYPSSIHNTYYLYSSSGQRLASSQGKGSWTPVALTTREGSYGYFPDSIKDLGSGEEKASFLKRSPVSFYGGSPEGNLTVGIVNDSDSAEFHHSLVVFHGQSTFKEPVPTVPHSLAVGEDAALVVGDSYEGERHKKDLVLVRSDGSVKTIDFPRGYDTSIPDFKYPHVNYLGDGLFEVLEGRTEGEVTRFKSFEVRISDNDELVTQKVSHFSMALHKDFAITRSLPLGENGVIDTNGNVFINHRDTKPPELTGKIPEFHEKSFVPVNFSAEALFGIRRKDSIEIRRWDAPEEITARLSYEKNACSDSACGISSISRTSHSEQMK